MKIISIVGARPNFMKIAPFIRAIQKYNSSESEKIEHLLLHTGQHYDDRMSRKFFEELNIPPADIHLGIGSGSQAEQVGRAMIGIEKVIWNEKPDWIVVVGDVNAILSGAVTAKKEHIKLAHIEAGLRSGDIDMPEEINRLVADRLSDLLFTPDRIASKNLLNEGMPEERIKFVGNIMIDTFEYEKEKAFALSLQKVIKNNLMFEKNLNIEPEKYVLVTLHRPSNVDYPEVLDKLTKFFVEDVSQELPIVWSVHPRTLNRLTEFGLLDTVKSAKNIVLLHPIGYHEMIKLNSKAKVVLTDSGGLQEESTVLGTPCLTLRWNTERPVTLTKYGGVSILVGNDIDKIKAEYLKVKSLERNPIRPELWDGRTAERIVKEIVECRK